MWQFTQVEKLQQLGAKPVTVSDSRGMIYDKDGIDLKLLKELKEVKRASLREIRQSAKKCGIHAY